MCRALLLTTLAQSFFFLAFLFFAHHLEIIVVEQPGSNAIFLVPLLAQIVIFLASLVLFILSLRMAQEQWFALIVVLLTLLTGWLVVDSAWSNFRRYEVVTHVGT